MRSLQWTPEQSVHIPEIDAEHQELFHLAADLRQALLTGDKTGRVSLLCHRLSGELSAHFSHEERLMREAEYPAYAWHERQHRTARSKMGAFERDVQRGERQAMFESLESFAAWLRDHTLVADRMAAAYLRNYWRAREFAAM